MAEEKVKQESLKQELDDVLGYGKVITIQTGMKDDKVVTETYHMCPVSLKDLPALQDSLNSFLKATEAGKQSFNEETLAEAANVIVLSLKRMHPDFTKEMALEKFGLGGLAIAVKTAMDINNFLSEMGEIQQQANLVKVMTNPQS